MHEPCRAKYTVYINMEFYVSVYLNTIIWNSRHRMFPFNALLNCIRFQTGQLKQNQFTLTLNASVTHEPVCTTYTQYVNCFIFQITLNKNTIISNSGNRMFPKFTYIACTVMFFRNVQVFRLSLNQNRFSLTLNNARYEFIISALQTGDESQEILRSNCNIATSKKIQSKRWELEAIH